MKSNYRFLFLFTFTSLMAFSALAQERGLGRREAGTSRGSSGAVNREPRVQSNPAPVNQGQQQARAQAPERTRPVFTDRARTENQGQQGTQRPVRKREVPNTVTPGAQAGAASTARPADGGTNPWNNHSRNNGSTPRPAASPAHENRGTNRNGNNPGGNNNASASRSNRGGTTNVYNNYQGNNYYNRGYYRTRPNVVYNAYNPSWRYNYYPRRNTIVTVFPFAYSTINFGGYDYRYYDGLYYQPYNNAFRVVAPPIGIYINILPVGYRRIVVRDYPYYYYNGTYYNDYNNSYRVVAPPVGAIVESIPDGYETIVIDGQTYYKVDDVQYKPVVQDNGEIWYEVIKVG